MPITRTDLRPDVPYRIRQAVGPWVDRAARALGQPEYRIRHAEYAGTVHCPMDEFVSTLRAGGFSWGPISWYHQPPVGRAPDGSWTYRDGPLADRQLHVVLYAREAERIDAYAHDEYNWMRHPVKHLKQVDIRRSKGAAEMRRWLDGRGLDYDHESRLRRRATRLAVRFRERLSP